MVVTMTTRQREHRKREAFIELNYYFGNALENIYQWGSIVYSFQKDFIVIYGIGCRTLSLNQQNHRHRQREW